MNQRQREQLYFATEWVRRVKLSRLKVASNILVCLLIFYIGISSNKPGLAISAMAFVQGVNLPEMLSAYQETKNKTRIEKESQEGLDKYR